jgi:Winged helix-turn helix
MGVAVGITREDHSALKLREFAAKSRDAAQSRRLLAIAMVLDGASRQDAAKLRELVIAGPDPAVHQVVRWRCRDLREEVHRRFKVDVNERTIGKWLRSLGLTRLQPRPYHPKKDPAAQEAFKKTSVPC